MVSEELDQEEIEQILGNHRLSVPEPTSGGSQARREIYGALAARISHKTPLAAGRCVMEMCRNLEWNRSLTSSCRPGELERRNSEQRCILTCKRTNDHHQAGIDEVSPALQLTIADMSVYSGENLSFCLILVI